MNYKKSIPNTNVSPGQGMIEALLVLFGILFIFVIVFPQISIKIKEQRAKNQGSQGSTGYSSQAENRPTENPPLCGEILVIPSTTGKAPFKVTLIGTGRQTKYPLLGFQWDFTGDSIWDTGITTEPQNYTFPSAGDYQIKMLVLDENKNSRTCLAKVTVTP
ncbi:MAG: hypothetical protein Q8N65_02400 [bacterium]|nr:hypothetical protein [bacterium]